MMAEVSGIVESLQAKQRGILDSKGPTPEAIEELSTYAIRLFIDAVSKEKKPDEIRAAILCQLAREASLDSILSGIARLSLFFAALPILFHDGRDPEIKPTVPSQPFDPYSSDPSAT